MVTSRSAIRRHSSGVLPIPQNHFRQDVPNGPVMIRLGEAEVLIRQCAQTMRRLHGRHVPRGHGLEQVLQRLAVDGRFLSWHETRGHSRAMVEYKRRGTDGWGA